MPFNAPELPLDQILSELRTIRLGKQDWCERWRSDQFRPRRPEHDYARCMSAIRALLAAEKFLQREIQRQGGDNA